MRVEAVRVCDLALGMLLGVPASKFQQDEIKHDQLFMSEST